MDDIPQHFSHLNMAFLKEKARQWADDYKTIIAITLHPYPHKRHNHTKLYTLVFEVKDPKSEDFGLQFILDQINHSLFGPNFLKVYKAYSEDMTSDELNGSINIPYRLSDQWDIEIIGPGEKFPEGISIEDFVQIYPDSYEERKNREERIFYSLIERALIPAERFWDTIVDELPISISSATTKDIYEVAQTVIGKYEFSPIEKRHLDRKLFKFSASRITKERQDFLKRIMKRIVDETPYGPITENKCHQIIQEIKKNKKK